MLNKLNVSRISKLMMIHLVTFISLHKLCKLFKDGICVYSKICIAAQHYLLNK